MASQPIAAVDLKPVGVPVPANSDDSPPVKRISGNALMALGQALSTKFDRYKADRVLYELKWLRNLRQYLGIYDPEVEKELALNKSRAYPRVTRAKCISILSRIMNLMFPGNDRNWELTASPNAEMAPEDVMKAIQEHAKKDQAAGIQQQPEMTPEYVQSCVQEMANEQAAHLSVYIDDQLQELGGDQTLDHIALARKVAFSGILYGVGLLNGPYVRTTSRVHWAIDIQTRMPTPHPVESFKPQFEFLSVWDYYPDLTAKSLFQQDGYFIRKVMTRGQLRALAKRDDFMGSQITKYLSMYPQGTYKAQTFETELKSMGQRSHVPDSRVDTGRYEVLVWHGLVSGTELSECGCDVAQDAMSDDIEAEVWTISGFVIKAAINQWRVLGMDVRMVHPFIFDEDDTGPIGNGMPNVMRDSQMSVAAATRMSLDNASVVCGPNLEVNVDLIKPGQDISGVYANKVWEREGTGIESQYPAVRNIQIESHLAELTKLIELQMSFADMESFVGPATGGDMSRGPSEPMRTAAGASMIRGDAALPFKDIVRNFDTFTQSYIYSLVQFNRKFNPDKCPEGDYNVIARGATSLVAKEVRGLQIDQLIATLTPDEQDHIDPRKLVEERFAVRDMTGLLVSKEEAARNKQARSQAAQEDHEMQKKQIEATIRETLASAFKDITQGQKNVEMVDVQKVTAGINMLEAGVNAAGNGPENGNKPASGASKG